MEFNEELGMKTYDEIVDSTLQGLIDKNVGITAANDGSVIRSLVEVLAEEEDTTNYFIEYVYRVMNTTPKKGGRMSKSKKYKIKQKDFEKLEKLAERIYNTVTVIDYFCRTQQEIEELYNLTPIVENLRRDSDTVNAYFINYPDNKNF